MIVFQFKENASEKHYVNKKRNSINIDYYTGIITLLNKYGTYIDFYNTFTNKQIDKKKEL